jgi:hypothetical protein
MTDPVTTRLNPVEALLQLAGGAVLPRCLHTVANLGVADALGETPQSAASLAAATGAHPGALDRVLRLLSAYGVFQRLDGSYSHTAASRLLRTDHPQSMHPMARMLGLPMFWASIGELEHSIRTALPATDKALPGGAWQHLASHPEDGRLFNQAMTAKSHGHIAGVLDAYDFSTFGLIGDIGGGHGHLLKAVLGRATQAKGVLFDQPYVIDEVKNLASDLSRVFRGKYLQLLRRLHAAGKLIFRERLAPLAEAPAFARWLKPLYRKDWVVYAKRPFAGPAQVLKYLARYTHRVAISNARLVTLDDGHVTFRYKDYADDHRHKTMTLSAEEFLRRFVQHVLPKGLVKVHMAIVPAGHAQYEPYNPQGQSVTHRIAGGVLSVLPVRLGLSMVRGAQRQLSDSTPARTRHGRP